MALSNDPSDCQDNFPVDGHVDTAMELGPRRSERRQQTVYYGEDQYEEYDSAPEGQNDPTMKTDERHDPNYAGEGERSEWDDDSLVPVDDSSGGEAGGVVSEGGNQDKEDQKDEAEKKDQCNSEGSEDEFSEDEFSEAEDGRSFAKNTGAYAPARDPVNDFFSSDDDSENEEEEKEEEDEESRPYFDFKNEIKNSSHVGLIKVEPRDRKEYLHVGVIPDVVQQEVLINAGVNRGQSILNALDAADETKAVACTMWSCKQAWDFIMAMASGEETLTTYCRLVCSNRKGEDVENTEKYFQKIRNSGFCYKTKNRTNRLTFEIYDGCNRMKVFLLFIRGKLAVQQLSPNGQMKHRLYFSEDAAVRAGDALKKPSGEIVLHKGISVLDAEDRKEFMGNPWHLFLLQGKPSQCAAWARNFNMKSTPFKYHQEIVIHVASCKQGSYGDKIHRVLLDWPCKNQMDDTPIFNNGMMVAYALLKLHRLYTKPCHKIKTPKRSKFDQVLQICEKSDMSTTEEDANVHDLQIILKEIKFQVDRTIGEMSVAHFDNCKRRRFKVIACASIDNFIERGISNDERKTKQAWENKTNSSDEIHQFLIGARDSLKQARKAKKSKPKIKKSPRRRMGASGEDDAVPPEPARSYESSKRRRERISKRQAR